MSISKKPWGTFACDAYNEHRVDTVHDRDVERDAELLRVGHVGAQSLEDVRHDRHVVAVEPHHPVDGRVVATVDRIAADLEGDRDVGAAVLLAVDRQGQAEEVHVVAGVDDLLADAARHDRRFDRGVEACEEAGVALRRRRDLEREHRLAPVGEQGAHDRHVVADDVLEPEGRALGVGHPADAR